MRTLIFSLCSSSVAALKINVEGWSQITLKGIACGGKKNKNKKNPLRPFMSGHRIKPPLSPLLCSSQEDMIIIGITPRDVLLAVTKAYCSVEATHNFKWFCIMIRSLLWQEGTKGENTQFNILLSRANTYYSFLCSPLEVTCHEAPLSRLVYLQYLHYFTKAADPRLCCFWLDPFLSPRLRWWKH